MQNFEKGVPFSVHLNLVYMSAPLTRCAVRMQRVLGAEQERREIFFHDHGANIPRTMFLCVPAAFCVSFFLIFFLNSVI